MESSKIPQIETKVIQRGLDDLVPTVDHSPRMIDEAGAIIRDEIHDIVQSYRGSGSLPLGYLSGLFLDSGEQLKDDFGASGIAGEVLEGLAQTIAFLTGHPEGSKYYPRALNESRYGRGRA